MENLKTKCLVFWYAFLLVLLLFSCAKKIVPIETKIETNSEVVEKTSDTNQTTVTNRPAINLEVNKPIPTIVTGVSKNCDSICNLEKEKIFNSLNGKVTQGKSEIRFYYDQYTKTFTAYANLQQSYDSISKTIKTATKSDTKSTNIQKPIIIEKPLTKEQTINLWTGRLFWFLLVLFLGWRFSRIFI